MVCFVVKILSEPENSRETFFECFTFELALHRGLILDHFYLKFDLGHDISIIFIIKNDCK